MKFRSFLSIALPLVAASVLWAQQAPPRVESFSPRGTVKGVRQVRARFSVAMVPFGDPRAVASPFEVTCPAPGTSRWADSRNWIFDFDADLEAGIRCEFRLRPGLRTLAGVEVGGTRSFAFSTGGPAITGSRPWEGSLQIEEEQVFLLTLDAAPAEATVLSNVGFAVEGIASRVGVRIVAGSDREQIIDAVYPPGRRRPPHLVLIQARQRFPAGAKVSLIWGRGVQSATGVAGTQDQVLPFKVREPFKAGFECLRENADAQCVPIAPMRLQFSAPIPRAEAARALLKGPGGLQWKPELDREAGEADEETSGHTQLVVFKGPFPEKSVFTLEIPAGIVDDSGRSLTNASSFPLTVRTDEYPPLAKFAADFGILELKGEPLLPVTLRNVEPSVSGRVLDIVEGQANLEELPETDLEPGLRGTMQGRVLKIPGDRPAQMLEWIRRLSRRGWDDRGKSVFGPATSGRTRQFSLPRLHGAKAFEVVGIPLRTPGFYVVEIESEILGARLLGVPKPMYVATSVLVTNMAVHFKWGRDSSLVWVTTLDKGKPVAGAEVVVRDCEGREVYRGRTDSSGLARTESLPSRSRAGGCGEYAGGEYAGGEYGSGLVVAARLGDDVTFTHTDWTEGIEPWRFRLPVEYSDTLLTAHTVFDRQLFRQGETVHMKHLLRRRGSGGFSAPSGTTYPLLSIRHLGSGQEYEIPLEWSGGGAESEWRIPAAARLGQYTVSLNTSAGPSIAAGGFRVEDYRVPLMRAILRPPASPLVTPSSVPLDLTITYLAGGGAAGLPVRLRHEVVPRYYAPVQDFEGFNFGNGRVAEGVFRGEPEEAGTESRREELQSTDLALDRNGSLRTVVSPIPKIEVPMDLHAEVEYRDPNGEVQTVSSRVPLWPTDRLVGIRPESWVLSQDAIRLKAAVVDLEGKPVAGSPVRVEMYESRYLSHRKRLAGGFYAYEHSTRVRRIGTLCEGKTDRQGLFGCEKPSTVSGRIILLALSRDSAGRETAAQAETWVGGGDDWWFRAEDDDRMDLLPETRRCEPGDKVRLQVRMPFREATALVTVEREGVIEAFVRRLSGKQPVIELPVRPGWAPNVFVSVLAVRGRVRGVRPTATVDLGRPAFKLGVTELKVGWRAYELKVRVESDRPVYRVRERAKVTVAVTTPEGKAPPPGSEVALAAVDEGLLELMPNESWNLLQSMMGQRRYGVETSTAQMHVVGKRHFGLKALPQGGGGGRQMTRELFDTLLLWRGRVALDAQGRASVEVPLNDSITAFRIAAVATAGVDRFGAGFATIRSTQDLILFSGVPPVARQGDRVRTEFSVRNASERPLQARVAGRVAGAAASLPELSVALAPGESKALEWEVAVPPAASTLRYEIEADAGSEARDRLAVEQRIAPAVPLRTLQATLARLDKQLRTEVAVPADALRGAGGVDVTFRPTLVAGLEGVADYMKRYPYTCLEQLVSRAVTLRSRTEWDAVMRRLPAYLDSDGLAKYFHSMRVGSDVLTAYVIAIAHEAGWEIPEAPRRLMLAGLRGFVEGKVIRHSLLPTADLSIRKLAAVEALTRHGVTDTALLSSISLEPELWPTSAVIDWLQVVRRLPNVRDRAARLDAADQILRSRLNFQGTTMGFSTEAADGCWWLMASVDANAVRLLLAQLESPGWREDIPRLVRGALGRMRRGHWGTTVANAWGTLAVDKFARLFELTPVSGTSTAELGGARQSVDWSAARDGATVSFPWPQSASPLLLTTSGSGAPWATIRSLAAIPLSAPLSSGFTIRKSLAAVVQQTPNAWTRGDIVRVRLELESQGDMTWVVVSDPIPTGATVLGSGLGRDSALATRGERSEGWVWPAFEERSFEAFRSYYEYVPKGSWTIEYTVRLNSSGEMGLPPTRVEAMYSPEMFGEIPNAAMQVK